MDAAMAPPLKRRKLTSSSSEEVIPLDNSTVTPESSIGHAGNHVHPHSSHAPTRTLSDEREKYWTPKKQHPVVGGIAEFKVLVPRQGTVASSASITSTASSVVVSASSYITASGVTSATLSSVSISSASTPADTVPAGVTTSPTTYISQTSLNSSTLSATTNSTSSNDTTMSSTSTSSTGMPTMTPPANLTTSAMIFIGDGTTTTSQTTLNLGNSSMSTTSTSSGLLFFFTLNDGSVSTFSRSSDTYTTTLGDGETIVVPSVAASTTTSSSRSTTSSVSSTTSRQSSTQSSSEQQSTITSTATLGGTGGAGSSTPTYSSPATTTTGSSGSGGGGGNSPPAGTIAGGVVGGAAGLAVLLLIAMLFVRWYRRKGQMQALPAEGEASRGLDGPSDGRGPGMAERAGLMPLVSAVPAFFRHQNRSAETAPSERGFTRVSGRKLPSAFSEGMSSEGVRNQQMAGPSQATPGMPLSSSPPEAERNLSSTSFYRDSAGFYGGDGERSSGSPPLRRSPEEMMTMSPGPQRQPEIHAGGPYVMSPTSAQHPGSPSAGLLGRSDTPSSLRNSRFTEDM